MYIIKKWSQFKRDYKKIINDSSKKKNLLTVLEFLINWNKLPEKYKDHELKWKYSWYRECHIRPDLLLIYKIYNNELILSLFRVWTHSELF